MIIFFGPTGSGKSVQGQLMAVRHGWRWISAGQLLRDTRNPAVYEYLEKGQLVPPKYVDELIFKAIDDVRNDDEIERVILDGYPRTADQAKALVDHSRKHGAEISIAIVLNVSRDEVLKRLHLRGRMEDNPETIAKRLSQYTADTQPVLDYLATQNVPVVKIDGVGTVGEVHDRIEKVLEDHKTVGEF